MMTYKLVALGNSFGDNSRFRSMRIHNGTPSSQPALYAANPTPVVIYIIIIIADLNRDGLSTNGNENKKEDDLSEQHVCGWQNI